VNEIPEVSVEFVISNLVSSDKPPPVCFVAFPRVTERRLVGELDGANIVILVVPKFTQRTEGEGDRVAGNGGDGDVERVWTRFEWFAELT
jgi:hypothetical protein